MGLIFARNVIYHNLIWNWRKHRLIYFLDFRDFINFFVASLKSLFLNIKQLKSKAFIEIVVTDKHIRAWMKFMESDADYLIIFEDDVIFKKDSIVRIGSLINMLSQKKLNQSCYIDLAGGLPRAALMIDQLETVLRNNFRHYKKPVTNTTCSYLMSRPLAAEFITIITKKPWLRLIPIDWLINNFFVMLEKENFEVYCLHADPVISKHGSFSGYYDSWQSKNPIKKGY